MPISGVVRFATIAGPAMAKTCSVVTLVTEANECRLRALDHNPIGRMVISFPCLSMIFSENRCPLFRIML
jgi:hypothetical protein